MYKKPVCKYCGKEGHYEYQCYKKMALKRSESLKKVSKPKKAISRVSSDSKRRRELIKQLDMICSLIVRKGSADKNGNVTCYICGARGHWKNFDCGHYCKRGYMHTRWDLDDLRCCCVVCNRVLNGNYELYTKKLVEEIGESGVQKLWDKAYKTDKITTVELEEKLKKLKVKAKEMGLL